MAEKRRCCLGVKRVKDFVLEIKDYFDCIKMMIVVVVILVLVWYGFKVYGHFVALRKSVVDIFHALDGIGANINSIAQKVGAVVQQAGDTVKSAGTAIGDTAKNTGTAVGDTANQAAKEIQKVIHF
ncbi:hypothetical protein EDD86DRAFT_250412 [Gorgonomyces haynaldii]|nr:hypothetical protein EDD86DRAFT_250412 [Gorgonomyces haynaldii]